MQKRHADTLTNRLEAIITEGSTYISWNELYMWYDVKAIAAATYRDLANRWIDITTEYGMDLGDLMMIQSPSKINPGITLFGSEMSVNVYSD
jgi:hypothetical protein